MVRLPESRMKRTGMVLQTILEGLGLGGTAGSDLRCGHPQRGCWDGASLQPGGAAAVREAGTYNTRENQAKFSDFSKPFAFPAISAMCWSVSMG